MLIPPGRAHVWRDHGWRPYDSLKVSYRRGTVYFGARTESVFTADITELGAPVSAVLRVIVSGWLFEMQRQVAACLTKPGKRD